MKEKFEIMADQEHYSLRWNNHQNHILRAFDTLLQTKTLVDVTLVCAETSIRAHKVVLSACSPFFQRVFSETPCKHPVIVLKDFRGWVVQAIVDFMYRGEISVPQERLSVLIQAGESLQVRGLVDHPVAGNTPTPAQSPEDFSLLDSSLISPTSPSLPSPNFNHHHARHSHQNSAAPSILGSSTPKLLLPPQVFADPALNLPNPDICTSPMPRRKQARPRRRSGDCAPQDLSSKPATPVPHSVDGKEDADNEIEREDDEELEDEDDDIKEILRRSESEDRKETRPQKNTSNSENNENDSKNNSAASTATLPGLDGPENLCMKKSSATASNSSSSNLTNSSLNNSGSNKDSRLSDVPNMKDSPPESTIGRLSLKDIRHLNRSSLVRSLSSLSPPPSFHLNNNPPMSHAEKRVKLEDRDDDRLGDDEGSHFLDHMDLALASHQHQLAHLAHHHSSPQLRPPGLTPDGDNNNSSSSKNNNNNNNSSSSGSGNGSNGREHGLPSGGSLGKDRSHGPKDFLHSPTLNFPPFFSQSDGPPRPPHSPLSFPHMASVSSLTLTPPHMFGLDSPLGLFPPGMDPGKIYSPLMEMSDPRGMHHDGPPFLKKKLNRPKGQHSAPRGGPPRSWTNAELTEALQHVWNKKMTTSQASRIFGIPYNSLLMYVRGKYGKSLKLEQLRKDCISGPPIELLQMGMNNNNNKDKKDGSDKDMPHHPGNGGPNEGRTGGGSDQRGPRSASSEPDLLGSPNPLFNPFPPGFYPDFPGGFPGLPLSMLNLLPPDRHGPHHQLAMGIDEDCKSDRSKQSMDDDYPQPLALNRSSISGSDRTDSGPGGHPGDSRREIYHQNGQD
ncbi:protein jim lovell [Topomyia yanbarensis]|uniref:protein jim lovell n=1 Tax=Topomyia yanbarensis TaxID=2498891 RepID=UPI00273AD721|nr:protein jim lovell [Topomyia yanbarensis]